MEILVECMEEGQLLVVAHTDKMALEIWVAQTLDLDTNRPKI
jgi:hypothetical protein